VNVEQVAERLHARRSGAGWVARCPAHNDRSPSLSISEGRDGRVLLWCFAGCPPESIVTALGMTMRDLFTSPHEARPHEPKIVRQVEQQLAGLRSSLTPRERDVLDVTVVMTDTGSLETAIARALALAVQGELVQIVMVKGPNEYRANRADRP
jgi:CHC2 zinc finger